MARGNSGRIVLEIEPSEKQQLHFAVRKDGLTLKEWFIRQMQNYLQALFGQISQAAACNRLHSNEERLSRWLLMSHDRVGVDEFAITHEFLGQMLGSRRATVSLSAGILQAAGLIRYHRGHVTILDREGLEAVSCECYGVIRTELERVVERANVLRRGIPTARPNDPHGSI